MAVGPVAPGDADDVDVVRAELNRTRAELDRTRAELDRTREASPIGWVETDAAGILIRVNDAFCRLLGYRREELLGRPGIELLVLDDAGAEITHDVQAATTADSWARYRTRQRHRHKNGEVRWFESYVGVLTDDAGNNIGYFAQVIDITDEVAALRAAALSEERYRLLAENASDAVFLSIDGRVQWVSPSITELLGWTPEELLGQDMSNKIHPDDRYLLAEAREHAASGAQARFRSRALTNSGEYRWVETIGRFFQTLDGQRGAVTGLRDIDEQMRLIQALNRSNEDLRQFSYAASHDLQAPLRTVSGFFELLMASIGRDNLTTAQTGMADHITTAISHMHSLIRDLLVFSRVDAERAAPAPVELATVVDQVRLILATDIQQANARVAVTDSVTVLGDERQLRQVFQNLIQNALTYAHPQRPAEIVICGRPLSETEAEIRITDNGIGIPQQYSERVFQLFQQLRPGTGTGIGLSLVRRMLAGMNGSIRVVSDGSSGSTFILTLPRA